MGLRSRALQRLHRWAIKIELHVRTRPLDLFQLCTLLFQHDLTTAGLTAMLGATSSSQCLFGGLVKAFDAKMLRGVLAFLNQYSKCRFEQVAIDEVMGPDFLAFLGERSSSMVVGRGEAPKGKPGRKEPAEIAIRSTRVFVVRPEHDAESPSSPTAFPLVLGGYIFLLDSPGALRGPGRFVFMHEVGHIAMAGNFYALRAHTGYVPFFLVAMYAAGQLAPHVSVGFVVGFYVWLLRTFLKTAWEVFSEFADAHHESQADFFAFANLHEADRKSAASFLRQYPISDMKLTPAFDEGRRKFLAENVGLIEAGEDRLAYHVVSADTPFFVWIALGLTAVLGLFMRRQDFVSLAAEMAIMVGTLAYLIFAWWRDRILRGQIEARLKARRV